MVIEWSEVSEVSEEEYRNHDYLIAYHGTSHRFRDSIENRGLLTPKERPEERVREDWQLSIDDERYDNLCYLSSESSAESYSSLTQKKFVGGKPMILQIKAPISNLEPEPMNADVGTETSFQAIIDGEVAHRGSIPPENILNYHVHGNYAIPPINGDDFDEFNEIDLQDAVLEGDYEFLEKWNTKYDTQLD